MKYIITIVGVEIEKWGINNPYLFLLDFSDSPISLCLWHWEVDDYVIYKRRKCPQSMGSLSRAFNNFSNRALATFCLHLMQKPSSRSPGQQALSFLSHPPNGCWSDIFKAPNWQCHLTVWKTSQESLWPGHVAFIPTQHPSCGFQHAHSPGITSQRAMLTFRGLGKLSGLHQAIRKASRKKSGLKWGVILSSKEGK